MIGIIDYKLGNVRAFANVYHELGIAHCIADCPDAIAASDRLILPGVGAFDTAMSYLDSSGLRPTIEAKVSRGCPILGVCVGMQMMFERSDEGAARGLGWLRGSVLHLRDFLPEDRPELPVPHMGWNSVSVRMPSSLFAGFDRQEEFYFLHSYCCLPAVEKEVIATCDYPDPLACAAGNGHIFGVQFHPEKSHGAGVRLLTNFARL